jgi:hypothetical protein
MKASEFDKAFDDGESVNEHLNLASARRPNLEQKRVNGRDQAEGHYSGGDFDDFLKEEDIFDDVTARAQKRLLALQLTDAKEQLNLGETDQDP